MKYFLHDTNAFQDEKITLLYMKYGFEGVGLFFSILEKIAMQEKPVREEVLKTQLYIGRKLEKQLNFMYEIGILSIKFGEVFNENLLNFSQKYLIKKEKTRKRVEEWRGKTENVTRYTSVTGALRNAHKDNISKVNKKKERKDIEKKDVTFFEKFWSKYPKRNGKKVGKNAALKVFNSLKLSDDDFNLLIQATENYNSCEFVRDAERFLKNEYWKDWIDGPEENNNGKIAEYF